MCFITIFKCLHRYFLTSWFIYCLKTHLTYHTKMFFFTTHKFSSTTMFQWLHLLRCFFLVNYNSLSQHQRINPRGVSTSTVERWPWAIPWGPPGRGSSARCWLCWRSRRRGQGQGWTQLGNHGDFPAENGGDEIVYDGLWWIKTSLRWIMMVLTQLKPVGPGQCSTCNLQSGTKGRWCSSWVSTPHCLALEDKQVAECTSSFAVSTVLKHVSWILLESFGIFLAHTIDDLKGSPTSCVVLGVSHCQPLKKLRKKQLVKSHTRSLSLK